MASEYQTLSDIGGNRNPVQETRFQELSAAGSMGSADGVAGNTGENLGNMGEHAFDNVPSVQGYVQGQFAQEDPFLNQLIGKMMDREKPMDLFNRFEETAGLPELRKTSSTLSKEINNIEDLLLQIEPDVSARSKESLVTEAQRRGMVEEGRKPHIEDLTMLGTALGRIQGGISEAERAVANKVQLTMQGQNMELEPYQLQYSVMVDRNARLLTGFTADRELQLDRIWDGIKRQREISDMEWVLANEIAAEERAYNRQLQLGAAENGIELKGGESYVDMLGLIGRSVSEQTRYDRGQDAKSGSGSNTKRTSAAVSDLEVIIKNSSNPQTAAGTYIDALENSGNYDDLDYDRLRAIEAGATNEQPSSEGNPFWRLMQNNQNPTANPSGTLNP